MRAGWCCTTAACTSMTDTRMSDYDRNDMAPALAATPPPPRGDSALVPRQSIAGHALVAVVAIMTFLASLTTGAVILVSQAASEWQSDVSREITIQIIPSAGRELDAAGDNAATPARAITRITDVRPS
jgi:cell division transport system permease protein